MPFPSPLGILSSESFQRFSTIYSLHGKSEDVERGYTFFLYYRSNGPHLLPSVDITTTYSVERYMIHHEVLGS
ncbi:hypothetical protein TanjilG_00806 [Lupinus angustifolius]|uniref:Uncharacterized protein n=1 Tax=Lupinus angustifolius TaxID=3871 RepID=A0A4P1R8J6_LUPAN|nr:hypothetical protein TanjilG_00806 [Lupinus angustifolius]